MNYALSRDCGRLHVTRTKICVASLPGMGYSRRQGSANEMSVSQMQFQTGQYLSYWCSKVTKYDSYKRIVIDGIVSFSF